MLVRCVFFGRSLDERNYRPGELRLRPGRIGVWSFPEPQDLNEFKYWRIQIEYRPYRAGNFALGRLSSLLPKLRYEHRR